jgi:hypothetical protein
MPEKQSKYACLITGFRIQDTSESCLTRAIPSKIGYYALGSGVVNEQKSGVRSQEAEEKVSSDK